jgi:hypothetical protein
MFVFDLFEIFKCEKDVDDISYRSPIKFHHIFIALFGKDN